jgi:glutaredoxin-related protein
MWSFRAYLKDKCADPEFLEHYHEQCNICPKTVLIINTIQERGLRYDDVARQSGIMQEHLELLESADRCSYDDVVKLSRYLGLPEPGVCKKTNRIKEKP